MAKFDYFEPADLAEALSLLKNYGEEAKVKGNVADGKTRFRKGYQSAAG
jgi:CO/xanthine dehydrogenase FAD-binding subunit